jgi:tetratricopeptide (TPR) repeat protein
VERALAEATWAEPIVVDAETDEALRSLGYVARGGGTELPRIVDEEMLFDGFDPKDLVDVVIAGRNLENGFVEQAEGKLARFFAREDSLGMRAETTPLRSLAHQNIAKAAMIRGEYESAAAEFEAALATESSNPDAAWGVVLAWNLAGRPQVAERRGRELMRARPGDEKLRLHRAISLALLNRQGEAVEALAHLAEDAKDPETAGVAAIYAEKIGGSEAGEYLQLYMNAELTPR